MRIEGGKFCRDGIYCREHSAIGDTKTPVFIDFSRWHEVCSSIGVEIKGRALRHLLEFGHAARP
jgi:hypothetical protein